MANRKNVDTANPPLDARPAADPQQPAGQASDSATAGAPLTGTAASIEGAGIVRLRRVHVEGQDPITGMSVLRASPSERVGRRRMEYEGLALPLDQQEFTMSVAEAEQVLAKAPGQFEVHPESPTKLKSQQKPHPAEGEEVTDAGE